MATHSASIRFALTALLLGTACIPPAADDAQPPAEEVVKTQSPLVSVACGYTGCADASWPSDTFGRWPGGVMYYNFASDLSAAWQTQIRKAMDDWERMTGGTAAAIKFQQTSSPSTAYAPVITIHDPVPTNQVPHCYGYNACSNGSCDAYMTGGAYHELGHCIGMGHTFNRYEAQHYLQLNTDGDPVCSVLQDGGHWAIRSSIPTGQNLLDFGPFDYLSTMQYMVVYPELTRWDGSATMPTTTCGAVGASAASQTCPGTLCVPTCTSCGTSQPQGFPTLADASGIAELYGNLKSPGWRKFLRTVNESVGSGVPFDYHLATGVRIPTNSSPAVGYEPPSTTSVWVTGDDGNVYKKQRTAAGGGWSSWSGFGKPSGTGISGPTSDPGVVSWAPGRNDVVAVRSGSVFIRSITSGSSGSWQSLGQPTGSITAASAPAITSWAANRLDVFVRGSDNHLYWRKCTASCSGSSGTWSAWNAVGASETFRGKPAVASPDTGLISVFVHSTSDKLRTISKDAGEVWSSWSSITTLFGGDPLATLPSARLKWDSSCPDCSSPAAGSRLKFTDVYVRGDDDKIWSSTKVLGGFLSFAPLGGVSTASPGVATRGTNDNLASVAITMAEERTRPTNTTPDLRKGIWLKDYDVRHAFTADIALGRNNDGRLQAVYAGVDDVLYTKWQASPTAVDTWTNNLMSLIRDRSKRAIIGTNNDGRLATIFIGADDRLRYVAQQALGSSFQYTNATPFLNDTSSATIDMAVGKNADGRLHLAYIGSDLILHQTSQTSPGASTWDGEHFLGTSLWAAKKIVIGTNTNGLLEAVFTGSNDVLYYSRQAGTSGANLDTWSLDVLHPSLPTAKSLTIGRNVDGRLQVVYTDLNNILYQIAQTTPGGAWGAPQFLGQSFHGAKEIAMAQNQDGKLEVFMVDGNDVIQHAHQNSANGTAWTISVLESTLRGSRLAANIDASNQLEVVYVGTDNSTVYRIRQVGANGTSWTAAATF